MELSGGQRYVAETHHQTQTTAWLGGTLVFSVRIREDLVEELGALSSRTGCSRNELIHLFLQYALQNYIIEWCPPGNHPCQPGCVRLHSIFGVAVPCFISDFVFTVHSPGYHAYAKTKSPPSGLFCCFAACILSARTKKRAGSGSFFRHNSTPWKAEERL